MSLFTLNFVFGGSNRDGIVGNSSIHSHANKCSLG